MLLERVFIFGGKGGVGKSTLACALALRLSQKDKTLLASLDPAHSLSGILGIPIGSEIGEVLPNLYAVELDAQKLAQDYVKKVLKGLEETLSESVLKGARKFAEIISSSPTSLETAVFDKLAEIIPDYKYAVLDFAPTGQLLRFFSSLSVLDEWLGFLVKLSEKQEEIDRFMGRKRNLPRLLKERSEKVKFLVQTLKTKGLLYAVAREEPLSLQEAEVLEKSSPIRTRRVINCFQNLEGDLLKVPKVEKAYGVENLKKFPIDSLLM
ncbi:ArsA family ATPase [Thermocrinis sp.]